MKLTSGQLERMMQAAKWAAMMHARPGQHARIEVYSALDMNTYREYPVCDVYAEPATGLGDMHPLRTMYPEGRPREWQARVRP